MGRKAKTWIRRFTLKNSAITENNDKREAHIFLWNLVKHHRLSLSLTIFAGLLAAVFEGSSLAFLTLALQALTGDVSQSLPVELGFLNLLIEWITDIVGESGLFFTFIIFAMISQLLRSGLDFTSNAAAGYLQAHVEGDVRHRIIRQLMTLSYPFLRRYKVGDLVSHSEQVNYLGMAIQRLANILSELFLVTAYATILLWLSWTATLGALVILGGLSLSLRRIVAQVRLMADKFKEANVIISSQLVEFLHGLRLIFTFSREDYAIEQVDLAIQSSVSARFRGLFWQSAISPFIDSLTVLILGVLLIGGYIVADDADSSILVRGTIFILVIYRLMPRVSAINKNWGLLNGYWPFVVRIASLLRSDDKVYTDQEGLTLEGFKQSIEFDHVSLQYEGNEVCAVYDLSFKINRGEMVAIVGRSGAGKSTLVDLLLRLYEPSSGHILVDRVNLNDLQLRSWREHIGVVSQNTIILNASVRENIAFGKPDATAEEILEAACLAHADDFIRELPDSYNTILGEDGYGLSGGQRQRLAIARAILRKPEILILDEATSGLDSQAEQFVQASISTIRSHCTVLAIAHRLSTISTADKILVLEQGRLVEQGTPKELVGTNGYYSGFFKEI